MGAQPGTPAAAVQYGEDYVQRMLEDMRRDTQEQLATQARAQAAVNADLTAKQVALEAAQATLTAQQATLTAQQATLTSLVSNQVAGSTHTASAGPVSTSAGSDYAVATVTVPSGYTRAVVMAVSAVVASGAPPNMTASTNIAGNLGFALYVANLAGTEGSGSPSHAVTLTGLTGGSTFNVSTRVVTKTAATNLTYFITTASVIWLK